VSFLRRVIILILLLPVIGFAQENIELVTESEIEIDYESELDIEELRRRILGEPPLEFMSFSLSDAEVSLSLTGTWKGDLSGNLGFYNSPLGSGFYSPQSPLLFKQEVDLTLSLWINERWFVEANFQDEYTLNTYRAGYQGLAGEFLQYAGIGNTGLDFPSFPYLDLGGDSASSFGFYSRFGNNDLNFHALLRYDAASREERVFSGNRERTTSDVGVQNFLRGVSFVLPDEKIDSNIIVYIEDEKGGIADNNGRRWRIALPSEYAASRDLGLLELNVRTNAKIAVSYSKNGDTQPWNDSMGINYSDTGKFLHFVQNWFGSSFILGDYPQCGAHGSSRPGEVIIGGTHALVIYEPGTFSPFERLNRYNAPSSMSERAVLVQLSTGSEVNGFELVRFDNLTVFASTANAPSSVSQINTYELLIEGAVNRRSAGAIWPLIQEFAEIYLPPKNIFSGDITLRFTNYNSTSGYFIGNDVIPGSVQVWRSGIQDTNFNYNQSSGEVIIFGSIGQNELIRITYLKRNEGTQFGSIAAGFGVIYQRRENPFSAQAAVGLRWNLADDSYTDEYNSSEGTVGISAKAIWNYDYFKAHVAAGFTLVQTDTTGLYRAAGMEGNETIINLPHELSFLSHPPISLPVSAITIGLNTANRSDLIYRNYVNNNILGNNLMPIDWNAPVISGINRPYPVNDSNLSARILTAEFKLDSNERWTGFQVPLDRYSDNITLASEIDIPFRFYDFSSDPSSDIRVIIQIGSLSPRDYLFTENLDLIWEKVIFPDNPDADNIISGNYRIARFTLNEQDRQELADAKFLRLIVVYDGSNEITGRVLLAPPVVRGSVFRPITASLDGGNNFSGIANTNIVTAAEVMETGVNTLNSAYPDIIRRFHSSLSSQRVLEIKWKGSDFNTGGSSAGADGRISELPLANYRELSFFINIDNSQLGLNNEILNFIVSSGPDMINNNQLEARIPISAFSGKTGMWSKVTVRYQGNEKEVLVDGISVPGASVNYNPHGVLLNNYIRRTSYIAILISPSSPSLSLLPAGNTKILIDEIILEDALMVYRFNTGAAAEYKRAGILLSAGSIPVLADFTVSSVFESEAHAQSGDDSEQIYGSIVSRTGMGFSLFDAIVTGNFSFTAAQNSFIWSADHSISRRFGSFSVRETFFASPYVYTARHGFNMSYSSDFSASFDADALYDLSRLRQRWNLNTGLRTQNSYIPSFNFNTEAVWTKQEKIEENESYGGLWLRSWEPLIPDSGFGTDTRRMQTRLVITQRTTPVGAILTLFGSTNFTGANNTTNSETSAALNIPVSLDGLNLNFRLGRGHKRHLYYSGNDVFDDTNKFFESISDFSSLWTTLPLYSFFSPGLNEKMDSLQNNSSAYYSSFNDQFNAIIILPAVYDLSAFYIPSRINFGIERVLEQKMDTKTDTLNLTGALGFSAINMFGAMGHSPVFNFYQSDEFSHVLETSFSIPKGEDVKWRFQSTFNAGFRGFSGGTLNLLNTLTIRSNGYWTESLLISWEAPTKRSMTSALYDWAVPFVDDRDSRYGFLSFLNSEYEQLRRETLEFIIDNSNEYLRWTAALGHEEIVRILGRLNFTTFIKLRLNKDFQTDIFSFDTQLGTTLRIIF